uniref:Inactive purple acid phosphatase 27 n=1 Tax=Solanum tuberosum TaxID=4113 RepID=M1C3W1_SOLTU
MDPPWVTKARGRGSYTRGRGRSSSSKTFGSSYGSSSSSPIIQRGGISLVKLTSPSKEATSSTHLDDIPENNPLYAQLQAYLSQKQSDIFASVVKEEVDDIRSYERCDGYGLTNSCMLQPKLISISNFVAFANPKAPLYPRLALGKSWDMMTVTWTSGYNIDEAVLFVEWGWKGQEQKRSPAGTLTFHRNSMCVWYTYKLGHMLNSGSIVWSKQYSFKSPPIPGQESL